MEQNRKDLQLRPDEIKLIIAIRAMPSTTRAVIYGLIEAQEDSVGLTRQTEREAALELIGEIQPLCDR